MWQEIAGWTDEERKREEESRELGEDTKERRKMRRKECKGRAREHKIGCEYYRLSIYKIRYI